MKTVAIITEKGIPGKDIKENTLINVFKLDGEKVLGYENITLESNDNVKFSKLLKIKEITLIYIESINNDLKNLLEKLGISIKCKDEWEGDNFITQFVFG